MKADLILKLADACENNEDFNFDSIVYCAVPIALTLFDLADADLDWGDFHDEIRTLANYLDIPLEDATHLFYPHGQKIRRLI